MQKFQFFFFFFLSLTSQKKLMNLTTPALLFSIENLFKLFSLEGLVHKFKFVVVRVLLFGGVIVRGENPAKRQIINLSRTKNI